MSKTTVATYISKTFNVHRYFTTQIAFHCMVVLKFNAQFLFFTFSKVFNPRIGINSSCLYDLLRDNGGAVRYGFNRYGDELGIFSLAGNDDVLALWPTVVDAEVGQTQAAGVEAE